jgi:exopolyphosphatase/guanosine-5'-triphosphate,3'-diphosphate pyrophosphatase
LQLQLQPVRCACIDIGSNTTRLLVADCAGGELSEVHQARAFTRIGGVLSEDRRIPEPKIAEVVAVVAEQLSQARSLGAAKIRAVATAAVRRAVNGDQLLSAIEASCGLLVELLSEPDEARLAFIGAARTLGRRATGELGVIDVGGGSTELAVGRAPDQIRWSLSLPVGSGDLTDRFLRADPPRPGQLTAARAHIASLLDGIDVPRPSEAIAVGGSATSLRRLVGDTLDLEALARALERLTTTPILELAIAVGLDPVRVRLLPGGLLILEATVERIGVAPVIGYGGIREGVVLELSVDTPGRSV